MARLLYRGVVHFAEIREHAPPAYSAAIANCKNAYQQSQSSGSGFHCGGFVEVDVDGGEVRVGEVPLTSPPYSMVDSVLNSYFL